MSQLDDLSSPGAGSSSRQTEASRRTSHACVQCRDRKQKCSGFTDQATCVGCRSRKVSCSFEAEARDPRYNPYLRIGRLRSRSPTTTTVFRAPEPVSNGREQSPRMRAGEGGGGGGVGGRRHAMLGDGSGMGGGGNETLEELRLLRRTLESFNSRLAAVEDGQQRATPPSSSSRRSQPDGGMPGPPPPPMSHQPMSASTTASTFNFDFVPPPPPSGPPPPDLNSMNLEGPLRTLRTLGGDDISEFEDNDPITANVLSYGEAKVLLKIFFDRCHGHAPFLDWQVDGNLDELRHKNCLLMLNLLAVAARFWNRSSGGPSWLHPRYRQLVALLDREMMNIVLHPRPSDLCLATVQALMVYSHWMPIDANNTSRFSEISAWQALGLAIRWAQLLGFDRLAHLPFLPGSLPSSEDVRIYRTYLYLVESDHYLAITARQPATLDTDYLYSTLSGFVKSVGLQATDLRLVSLFRVAHAVRNVINFAPSTQPSSESVRAFIEDVLAIERDFSTTTEKLDPKSDSMLTLFPYTSLRWYRVAVSCMVLTSTEPWQSAGDPFRQSVDWASQILYRLCNPTTAYHLREVDAGEIEPSIDLVDHLAYAIDQYFVVIAYTASFLVLAWQRGAIDSELESLPLAHPERPSSGLSQSTLYRLVILAAKTLDACSASSGHLGCRYSKLLFGIAKVVASGHRANVTSPYSVPAWSDSGQLDFDLATLWQQAGLDPALLSAPVQNVFPAMGGM